MSELARIPDVFREVKTLLRRSEWRNFPDVIIHADESAVKKHQCYESAKMGDLKDALILILETISTEAVKTISEVLEGDKPNLLAVHALETSGVNVIPQLFANILSDWLEVPVSSGVIQVNRVTHTGASGYHRLAFPALFSGVIKGQKYFLVDDFIGQGGTLANLKGFIESQGAKVVGATTLTGKAYSAKLNLAAETLQTLREKYGDKLEIWWNDAFGFGFDRLTESEARYLIRSDDAHTITNRIVAARTN